MIEYLDLKVNIDEDEVTFRLKPMLHKRAMKTLHKFMGAISDCSGNIMLIPYDTLDEIAQEVFKNAFVEFNNGEPPIELKEYDKYFGDKLDVFYETVAQAMRINCPDFFRRMEKKAATL